MAARQRRTTQPPGQRGHAAAATQAAAVAAKGGTARSATQPTTGTACIGLRGRHHWLIEVTCEGIGLADRLAGAIDARLAAGNDDYAAQRRARRQLPRLDAPHRPAGQAAQGAARDRVCGGLDQAVREPAGFTPAALSGSR
ncbi:hypothetical protein ACLF3G_10435 [Falsiroseomonas sp. HC035]|uniref:hypothetical protein n=1 Tax=Falsiroseomonas sp. HC035 TaxID=3390999 RepID=UPI003D322EA5